MGVQLKKLSGDFFVLLIPTLFGVNKILEFNWKLFIPHTISSFWVIANDLHSSRLRLKIPFMPYKLIISVCVTSSFYYSTSLSHHQPTPPRKISQCVHENSRSSPTHEWNFFLLITRRCVTLKYFSFHTVLFIVFFLLICSNFLFRLMFMNNLLWAYCASCVIIGK